MNRPGNLAFVALVALLCSAPGGCTTAAGESTSIDVDATLVEAFDGAGDIREATDPADATGPGPADALPEATADLVASPEGVDEVPEAAPEAVEPSTETATGEVPPTVPSDPGEPGRGSWARPRTPPARASCARRARRPRTTSSSTTCSRRARRSRSP